MGHRRVRPSPVRRWRRTEEGSNDEVGLPQPRGAPDDPHGGSLPQPMLCWTVSGVVLTKVCRLIGFAFVPEPLWLVTSMLSLT